MPRGQRRRGDNLDEKRRVVSETFNRILAEINLEIPTSQNSVDTSLPGFQSKIRSLGLGEIENDLLEIFQLQDIKDQRKFIHGIPGVVLIAILGRLIDTSYNPSINFYQINPRPLFEVHLRHVLSTHKVPTGLSAALNVAKGISVLDENWANGRLRVPPAMAAVRLIRYISSASEQILLQILTALSYGYILLSRIYTKEFENIDISAGIDLYSLFNSLTLLIKNAPAGGATTQFILGVLFFVQYNIFGKKEGIEGVGESVFATNTTSKKPGDFFEHLGNNHFHVYEVTTKKIDQQRLEESAIAVQEYVENSDLEIEGIEVTFLCRPEDYQLSEGEDIGKLPTEPIYLQGIRYYFIDIRVWIFIMLERIGTEGRRQVFEMLEKYVTSPNTELKVKATWRRLRRQLIVVPGNQEEKVE